MNITINGIISLRFAPELKDNMSTKELMDSKIFGYIEKEFKDGDCIYDSFNYIQDSQEYKNIIIYLDYGEDDFKDWFIDSISQNYISSNEDKEYLFKSIQFEELSDRDALEIRFEADLWWTFEELYEEYQIYKESCLWEAIL